MPRLRLRPHRVPRLTNAVLATLNRAHLLLVDYPPTPVPRYGHGAPPHPGLAKLLEPGRSRYAARLRTFVERIDDLRRIPLTGDDESPTARWENRFVSGLDAIAIYSLLASGNPRTYLEVGSGSSTTFARRAIQDHGLRTRIVSIDPAPRAAIDAICDEVIRTPLERADLARFERLEAGDVVYIDNSHRAFMNSDVTVCFLDVLPRLAPGVQLGIDDIYLPFDYPWEWRYRYYSEQYMLAAYLLGGSRGLRTVLPCAFVGADAELTEILQPFVAAGLPTAGTSFWLDVVAP